MNKILMAFVAIIVALAITYSFTNMEDVRTEEQPVEETATSTEAEAPEETEEQATEAEEE